MNSVLVGRTPVFTEAFDIFAYDLNFCNQMDADQVGAGDHVFLRLLTKEKPGFIRMRPDDPILSMDAEGDQAKCIPTFDMPALAEPSGIKVASKLAEQGCQICCELDATSDIDRIPAFVSICSVDAIAVDELVKERVEKIRGKGLQLLTRNIDSAEQYARAKALKFDLFHGRYFERSTVAGNTEIPASKLAALHLLAHLQDPSVDINSIEQIISQDMTLSYKVLRLVNAAFFGLPKRVDSIHRAVVFLGLSRVRNWASVIVVNSLEYQPRELLMTALVRARSCELLAQALGRLKPDLYYISGLFSMLDAVMEAPKVLILQKLNLHEEIEMALLSGQGAVGEVLRYVLAVEHGLCTDFPDLPIEANLAMQAYIDAVEWAEQVHQQIAV